MTQTQTYALLPVSQQCFNEVCACLRQRELVAGETLVMRQLARGHLVMDGLALVVSASEDTNASDAMKQRIASRLFGEVAQRDAAWERHRVAQGGSSAQIAPNYVSFVTGWNAALAAVQMFAQPDQLSSHDPSGAEQVRQIFDQHLLPSLLNLERFSIQPDDARRVRAFLRLLRDIVATNRLDAQMQIEIVTAIERAAEWCPGVVAIRINDAITVEIQDP